MMKNPFVWFDNLGTSQSETTTFLESVFGWSQKEMGPMTLQSDGENGPFAGVAVPFKGLTGWIPYVEVEDLAVVTRQAEQAGADIVASEVDGPVGTVTFLRDPGGSALALWKRKAEG